MHRFMGQVGFLLGAAVLVALVAAVAIKRRRGRRSSGEVVGILNDDGVIELIALPRRLAPGESKLRVVRFPEGHSIVTEAGWETRVEDRDLEEVLATSDVVRLQLYCSQISDGMLARIVDRHCGTLEVLSVHSTAISDDGLLAINRCSRLIELNAFGTKITDQTLGRVAGLSRLRRLFIGQTGISDEGFRHLRSLPSLEVISALHCDLSVESLAVLPTLRNLKVAFLAGNNFSEDELGRFRTDYPGIVVEMTDEEA